MKNELFNRCLHSLGAPVRNIELLEEQLQTFLDIATEDIQCYLKDKNKEISDNLEIFLIEKMFFAQTKNAYARTKTMFGDPNDGIDYEQMMTDYKWERDKIYEIIDKS